VKGEWLKEKVKAKRGKLNLTQVARKRGQATLWIERFK
jgi:hypothetical protein